MRLGEAALHLFADVRYLLWVNGKYVTRGPARFNPKGPEYDTVPIDRILKAGVNTIAVLVMANASNGKMMHHAPGLTARLEAAGVGGSHAPTRPGSGAVRPATARPAWSGATCATGLMPVWRTATGRCRTMMTAHWQAAAAVDGAQWGPLTPRRIPLLRETPLPAAFSDGQALPVTLTAGQEISFDLGRLAQAYTALDLEADAGTTLTLAHAGISYTARAGRQTYLSSDTCGFQTATLRVNTGRVTLHQFGAVERRLPVRLRGPVPLQ